MRLDAMLHRTIHALAVVAVVVAVSACGAASGRRAASVGAASGGGNHAGDPKRAAVLVRQAFAANPKAN